MRRDDWPEQLARVFAAARGKAPVYGEHDCAMHAFECAEAMIEGLDLAAAWRGTYADYLGGLRVLRKRLKLKTFEAYVDTLWPRTPPALARRGDWGMVAADEGPALMVFDGAVLRGPCGVTLPRTACLREQAWSVG